MRSGVANLEIWAARSFLDWITGRPGLFFCPDDDPGESVSIGRSRRAFYCPGCHALLIPGVMPRAEPDSSEAASSGHEPRLTCCAACGAPIAPEDRRCPQYKIALQ